MKLLNFSKYYYGVGPMTVANSVAGHLGTVTVDDMLEQHGADLFLRRELALAIADARRHRYCTRKPADSGEPKTKWAEQPIETTLIKVPAPHRS